MRYRLRTKRDHGSPTEAKTYNRAVASLDDLYSVELFHDGAPPPMATNAEQTPYYGALMLVLVGFVGVSALRMRKRSPAARVKLGDTADAPLPRVADPAAEITKRKCQCGVRLVANESLMVEGLRLGERRLVTIEVRCAACAKRTVVYADG